MISKKHLILPVDQNRLVLPQALIPENTRAFIYELQEDGRIILSPLSDVPDVSVSISEDPKPQRSGSHFSNVIDFRKYQIRLKNKERKHKKSRNMSQAEGAGKSCEGGSFVRLCNFPSRLEAEMLGEILRQAEIPYIIQSEDIGIFGPGAAPAPGGARIAVREADLEYAKVALSGLI